MISERWVIPLAKRANISPKEDIMLLISFEVLAIIMGSVISYFSYQDGILTNFIIILSFFIVLMLIPAIIYGRNIYQIISSNKAYKYTVVYREDEFLILYDYKNRMQKIPYHDVVMIEGRPKSIFAFGPMIASYRDNNYGKLIFTCQNQGRMYKMKISFVKAPIETASKMIEFYKDNSKLYDTEIEFIGK